MKITTKINFITTAWILCILLAVNTVVFFSFMNITVNVEKEGILEKAHSIIKDIKMSDSNENIQTKLTPYLTSHSYIRIIQPDSQVASEVSTDNQMAQKMNSEFSPKQSIERHTIRQTQGEEQILIVKMPIESNGQVLGTLELGERLMGLELGKDVLLWILASCTILGGALALFGGRWLSNIIMKPISYMIDTMEDIEQSGIPKKIVIQKETKDELQKMAVTFNRMIDRLYSNLDKQRQFISDASHELKTPLTIIKSYSDHLLRRGVKNEQFALEAIESIHSETTRIQKMTERFLDLANSELDEPLDTKPINLISLSQETFKLFKEIYNRDIFIHFNDAPISITADELKVKQVIIILLDNALKYSTDNINVYLDQNEQDIIIRVVDYGIGIAENDLENIFERFYRVDKARNRETGSTGLGLSIAKNIMEQHNGKVEVKSIEGQGTEVVLSFPKTGKK
ncbi:sensor histidine kinase [Psychrobacillus sp. L4]|uniref:sensor histidine kinase n=1 Tax=Psychrobacillus sp. L4 TaxID=3236892 RepID=UPI0036F23F01